MRTSIVEQFHAAKKAQADSVKSGVQAKPRELPCAGLRCEHPSVTTQAWTMSILHGKGGRNP